MSQKKATPRAVFNACEALDLQGGSWNRDDVRMHVGGGSFSVIDPLIQAWRKMQPVREVAPSLPADLLIQVVQLLEEKVSGYIDEVDSRDNEREASLMQANELLASNLQEMEVRLTDELERAQFSNHQLEAECSRLEAELKEKNQQASTLEVRLESAVEQCEELSEQGSQQKSHYEQLLLQAQENHKQGMARVEEKTSMEIGALKSDHAEQMHAALARQQSELARASEVAENRLMHLLDQSRRETKEVRIELEGKGEVLAAELQASTLNGNQLALEVKSLTLQLSPLNEELAASKEKYMDLRERYAEQEKTAQIEINTLTSRLNDHLHSSNDLSDLKATISSLQKQMMQG